MGSEEKISFVPTPEDIRDSYQYFTEASMKKLQEAGYPHTFAELEAGISDYVENYLLRGTYE